jgi:hypothetical protein
VSADYYAAFLALTPDTREAFSERVDIIDGTATVAALQPALERVVRKSVKPQRRAALVDRLRGLVAQASDHAS